MPGEGQRGTLDAPSQQPMSEIVVKTPQLIEVDSVLINPHELDDQVPADGAMLRKHGVVDEREPIVLPRIVIGCAALE